MTRPTAAYRALRQLSVLMLVTWLLLPLIPLAVWSVSKGWFFPNILPRKWTLDAWAYALSDTAGVLDAFGLSLWISGWATALAILVGVPAGRALGLYNFPGKSAVQLLILAPTIVPGIATVLGLQNVFLTLGLANTVNGVVLAHLIPTLPYMTLVMAGVFANFDPAFEAQARSLGARPAQIFRYVTLPAILPGLVAGALFAFLVSWSQYILTLVIGGGRVQTLPLALFNFAGAGRNDITGTIAMIYVLPGVLFLIFTARYLSGRNTALTQLGRP
jgi:putative spermidine/putrescine transport system permease protein